VWLRMIEGELYQLTKNGDIDITEDEHFDIIRRKTAYLFAGCAQIGGMLGNETVEEQGALRDSRATTCSASHDRAAGRAAPLRLPPRYLVRGDARAAGFHRRHDGAGQDSRRRPA